MDTEATVGTHTCTCIYACSNVSLLTDLCVGIRVRNCEHFMNEKSLD